MKTDKHSDFGVTDHSATAKILKKGVSERLIEILPESYSPNALTLTGGALATLSALTIWFLFPEMQSGTTLGKLAMMSSAILLIMYAVFDQLDGMQARRLNRASPFGDFLDHWVDTIIANNLTVPVMVMLQLDHSRMWLMAFIASLAFWAHNWETRNSNYRSLPVIGGLESVWTGLAIMTVTSIYGLQVWRLEWQSISLLDAVYWYGIAALAWVVIKAVRTSQVRLMDYLGFIGTLLPICIWHLMLAPVFEPEPLIIWVSFVTMGFIATQSTGYLMRHLWLGGNYQSFDLIGFLLGVALCGATIVANLTDMAPGLMLTAALLIAGISMLRVAVQGITSYRQMMRG